MIAVANEMPAKTLYLIGSSCDIVANSSVVENMKHAMYDPFTKSFLLRYAICKQPHSTTSPRSCKKTVFVT